MYIELDGFEVAQVLNGPERDALANALVGCTFYPNEKPAGGGLIVEAVDPAAARLTVRTSAGKPFDIPLVKGVVESTPGIQAPIERERARRRAPDPQDVAYLRAAGIEGDLTREDAKALAETLVRLDLPSQPERFRFWSIAKGHDFDQLVSVTARKWAALVRGIMPADLAIQFASVQRTAHEFEDALKTVDGGLDDPFLQWRQNGILLTQRAAVLLDLYDRTGDRSLLAQAREAHSSAASIDPDSPYLAKVGARIDRASRR